MISVPLRYLLGRPQAYSGLVLLALTSVLIGPLMLEVIFNHRDLWFDTMEAWQSMAFPCIWQGWNTIGVLITLIWGLDRSFDGLHQRLHLNYASLLSVIAALIYNFFAIPVWYWLWSMNLVSGIDLLESITLSYIMMTVLSLSMIYVESYFNSLVALSSGVTFSVPIFWFTWQWIQY
jgi:hypothetical protein